MSGGQIMNLTGVLTFAAKLTNRAAVLGKGNGDLIAFAQLEDPTQAKGLRAYRM